jgi:hypothetical protein
MDRMAAAAMLAGFVVGYRAGAAWCERQLTTPCRVCGLLAGAHELGCPYAPRSNPSSSSLRIPPRPRFDP